MNRFKYVGTRFRKSDALALATGNELFTDDFSQPGMVHAAMLHAQFPHAKIRSIDDREARRLPGVIDIFTTFNVDPILYTTAGQGYPEPSPYDTSLFPRTVRFVGDSVALVVARTLETARAALALIKVDYERKEAVLDFEKAENNPVIVHSDDGAYAKIPVFYDPGKNVAAKVDIEIGDFDGAFASSTRKIEQQYHTPYAAHCALEPHAAFAWPDHRGRVVIVATTQVPFHVRRIVSAVTGIPVAKIRVIKPRIGGGFGGKQEVLLEPYAALAAWRLKKPVKLVYSRSEVFTSSRTRHQYRTTFKVGYEKEGSINAISLHALENAGAYGSHALTVLTNAGAKTLPLLNKVNNVRFSGLGVYTNLPVGGAYRGYGASEATLGINSAVDIICDEAGIDPVEWYLRWAIKPGESSPLFKALGEGREGVEMVITSNALEDCLKKGSAAIDWGALRKAYAGEKSSGKRIRRGVGMAALMQGSAIPEIDMASAYMKMNDDGSFNLLIGATDIGTGSDTIMAQIAAEALGTSPDEIVVTSSDTDHTPFDTGAYASSTTYLSGEAVRKCATEVRKQVLESGAEMLELGIDEVEIADGHVVAKDTAAAGKAVIKSVPFSEICQYRLYQHNQYQIQATASHICHKSPPPFAAHFAEVEVDTWTGVIKVLKYVAACDCGTTINAQLAEGQVEGALVNGLSYALIEDYFFSQAGRMLNDSFGRYKIYSAADIPEIVTIMCPSYEDSGPYGAKSVSEININGPMPAIANAVYMATGKRLTRAPFLPEYVLAELKKKD